MALRSGFWNALPDANGEYFPKYNGDDFDRIGSLIIENGVVKDGDALQVSENTSANNGSSYSLKVKAGVGFINGKWFVNSTEDNTTLVSIPSPTENNKRFDLVVVRRCNNIVGENNRSFILKVIQGTQTTGTPTEPALSESDLEFDICLARVLVSKVGGVLSVSIKDMRTYINGYWGEDFNKHMSAYDSKFNSTLGELQQRADNWIDNNSLTQGIVYRNTVTLSTATNTVSIGIEAYQYGVDTLNVYTNADKEYQDIDYTINSDGTVTFIETKAAGVKIHFEVIKYVDGTTDVTNAYTELEKTNQRVEELESFSNEYNYLCNGSTDNVEISNLVNDFLKADLTDYSMKKINVYGTFGMTAAYNGTGESNNAYKWINFANTNGISNRKVILDFSNCSELNFPIVAGTNNILFYFGGNEVIIQGVNFLAQQTGSNTTIQGVYATADMAMENCRGWISCYNELIFTTRGRYDNCRVNCTSANSNATVFNPSGTDYITVNGGEYYAYEANGTYSAIVYHATDAANAVTVLNGVRMPTGTRSGYNQTNATRINNGYLSMINCVTALSNTTAAAATVSNVGTIPVSR